MFSLEEPASDPRAKRRLAQVVEDELGLEDAAELAGRSVEAILRPMAYQTRKIAGPAPAP